MKNPQQEWALSPGLRLNNLLALISSKVDSRSGVDGMAGSSKALGGTMTIGSWLNVGMDGC